jgi:hypothetical protein
MTRALREVGIAALVVFLVFAGILWAGAAAARGGSSLAGGSFGVLAHPTPDPHP